MLRNILSNWTGLIVAGVFSFLLTPVMIHHLGVVYYGMWILAASLLDYYGVIDVAMRAALFRFVARFKGSGEHEALADTISTSMAVALVTSLGLLTLIPIITVVLPRFFSTAKWNTSSFQVVLALVAVSLALVLPARVLGSYLSGTGRFDLYNVSAISVVSVRSVLFFLLLIHGYGIVALAAVTLGTSMLSLVLNWRLLRYADPDIRVSLRFANWARAKELASYGSYAFVNTSGESLRSYTDAAVIARVLTIALVTPFNVATRLMDYFQNLMSAVNAPLLASMSELSGRAPSQLANYLLRSTKYMALISMFIASLFVLDGKALIYLWVGPAFLPSYTLLVILTAGYVVCFAQSPSQMVAFALARHRPLAFLTLAEGLTNLLLSIYWAHKYGLIGVALGTTVPLLISKMTVQPWYAMHLTGISPWRYVSEAIWRPLAVGALYLGLCEWQLVPQADASFLGLASFVSLQALLFLLLAYGVGLLPSEREFLWTRSKRVALVLHLVRAE